MNETAPNGSAPAHATTTRGADAHPAGQERIVLPPPEIIDHMIADLEQMPTTALMGVFTQGVELFDSRMFELRADQLDMAFLASAGVGREPVRVLLGLLADRELRFASNLRRTVAIDGPLLMPDETDTFIDAGLYRGRAEGTPGPNDLEMPPPIGGFVGTIHTIRHWTLDWLGVLPDAAWDRAGMDPERGPQTIRQQVARHLAHFQRDAVTMCAKVEHFLGPAPQRSQCADQGPTGCGKPSCACR